MLPRPMVNVRTYYKRSLFKILGNKRLNKQNVYCSNLKSLQPRLKWHRG